MEVVAIVGVVASVCSLVVAIWAVTYAKQSRDISSSARQLSVDANDLSRESNTIAEAARDLATEANDYAHRAERRETEFHDVSWDQDWVRPGEYQLTNTGDDTAYNVKSTISVDGEERCVRANSVPGGESLMFDFPEAARELSREVAAWRREQAEAASNRLRPADIGYRSAMHTCNYRIVWTTEQGVQKEDANHFFMALGDWGAIN